MDGTESQATRPKTWDEARARARLWPFWLSIGAMVFVGCAVTLGIAYVLLVAIGGPRVDPGEVLTGSDLLEVVRLALFVTAGIGGVVGLVITYRRQRVAEAAHSLDTEAQHFDEEMKKATQAREERVALENQRDASERLITSLYTSAVEQLGSDKPAIRMGALHSLERIGQSHRGSRQAVIDVLCGYLRLPFKPRETRPGRQELRSKDELRSVIAETHVRFSIQQMFHRHLVPPSTNLSSRRHQISGSDARRRRLLQEFGHGAIADAATREQNYWEDIHLNLRYADIVGLDLRGAAVASVDFAYANLHSTTNLDSLSVRNEASFAHTRFWGPAYFGAASFGAPAFFHRARFRQFVSFECSNFADDADFVDASFHGICQMMDVTFGGSAYFDGGIFRNKIGFDRTRFRKSAEFGTAAFFYQSESRVGTQFRKEVDFCDVEFCGRVSFHGSRFSQPPSFSRVKVVSGDHFRRWPEGFTDSDFPVH